MKHGSLFSGIGGFDLAAEWMGWENVFHCEWNPFGQRVLKHHFPNTISYNDITKTDFSIHRGNIDIISGGFPCQPYSSAGKRLGKEDDRHLWPEMLRAIMEVQPSWVVGENVRGLTNWNGGMVFDEVQAELEAEGYEVIPFLLPACAVNAPPRRDRIWFVAYSQSNGWEKRGKGVDQWEEHKPQNRNEVWNKPSTNGEESNAADTNNTRQQTFNNKISFVGKQNKSKTFSGNSFESIHRGKGWQNFPTQSPVCTGNDGISDRLDSITFPKWRNESIKAAGNAIVPQVVLNIFRAIEMYENI